MPKEFDPAKTVQAGYDRADWDVVDSPALTDEQLANGKPFAHAFPEIAETARRGRPPKANPKIAVSLRLDADLVETLRASGKGWQSRVNTELRRMLKL